jgi:hypothetical protein
VEVMLKLREEKREAKAVAVRSGRGLNLLYGLEGGKEVASGRCSGGGNGSPSWWSPLGVEGVGCRIKEGKGEGTWPVELSPWLMRWAAAQRGVVARGFDGVNGVRKQKGEQPEWAIEVGCHWVGRRWVGQMACGPEKEKEKWKINLKLIFWFRKMNEEILMVEIIGKISQQNIKKFGKERMWTWVNFGSQEFAKRISRLQRKFRKCQYATLWNAILAKLI